MEDNLLEELLSIANSDTPAEFGSGNLHLLSQPLSHWECGDADDHSFSSLAVPLECVGAADLPSLEDDLLLQASQLFTREEEKEEDTLLLAASQQSEKRCGPLMTYEDIQLAVLAQVPANTKRSNNWATSTWQAWAIHWP